MSIPVPSKQECILISIALRPETDVWYIMGIQPKSSSTDLVDVKKVGELMFHFGTIKKVPKGMTWNQSQREI